MWFLPLNITNSLVIHSRYDSVTAFETFNNLVFCKADIEEVQAARSLRDHVSPLWPPSAEEEAAQMEGKCLVPRDGLTV